VELGKKDAAKSDPQDEVAEFRKAAEVESTPEIGQLLQTAEQQFQQSTDEAAVTSASTMSAAAEEDKDYVKAYEVLDNLTPSQRKMVADRLNSLKDRYIQAASLMATDLQRTHSPIKGLSDEIGVQRAYDLVGRCYALTNDPSLQDRLTVLGQILSAYYLAQAKHYLDRPDGTGANVGWTYLAEALKYKGADADAVRDEMTRANAIHLLRSKLSISVRFRDQTSRREAVDFAQQLTDSLATGLESSNRNISVFRPNDTPAVHPNFALVGDVLQNTESNSIEKNAKTSTYRSGQQEIPNEAWNAANREYESANIALTTAQASLQGAIARGKKGQISDETNRVADATKKVLAARVKLDSLPKTYTQDVERPYTYTEQINHLKATVDLQFRIEEITGNAIVPPIAIRETQEKPFTILEGVKPDDTTGVHVAGEVPSETQFLERVEYSARDRLLKESKEKIISLPLLILQSADRKASQGDNDGAAELYMLYLDSTESQATPERRRAQKFLLDNYNFRAYGDSPKA
jgi:hypothetical protein